jgi:hypothetical protein
MDEKIIKFLIIPFLSIIYFSDAKIAFQSVLYLNVLESKNVIGYIISEEKKDNRKGVYFLYSAKYHVEKDSFYVKFVVNPDIGGKRKFINDKIKIKYSIHKPNLSYVVHSNTIVVYYLDIIIFLIFNSVNLFYLSKYIKKRKLANSAT